MKMDRNVEKTRSHTLSGVKGRAPGAVPNKEEIIIPGGSFSPLNLDPLGGDLASPSDSERGSVPSPLFFHYLSPPSSSSSHILEALGAILPFFGDFFFFFFFFFFGIII